MNTNGTAVYGIYTRNIALPDIVGALNRAGFENRDICMVLSPAHPDAEAVRDAGQVGVEGKTKALGARMIGWFSQLGAVVIPTFGFFIRSEVFSRALLTEQEFLPALSQGSRTLLGLGFSPDDARRLGHKLCDVSALIYVSCREGSAAHGTTELLRRAGAQEAALLDGLPTGLAA
jgi:hypothetical protein